MGAAVWCHSVAINLDELLPAETTATLAATEVASRYQTMSLVEHCSRAYLWAALVGEKSGLKLDRELLYVAAMLHDLGLSPAFDNVSHAFEIAGGDLAWVFATGAGWEERRADHLREIIIRHMGERTPAAADDAESHVLYLATGFDISGHNRELWPADFQASVLARHPRHTLAEEFSRAFADQAARKPTCAAAASMQAGIADRIFTNPLDS